MGGGGEGGGVKQKCAKRGRRKEANSSGNICRAGGTACCTHATHLWQGHKEVLQVWHHEHAGQGARLFNVVVVHAIVKGDKANERALCSAPASNVRQGLPYGCAGGGKDARAHCAVAHIQHKDVDGGLGGAHHVLHGRHKLHAALAQLWAGVEVLAHACRVRGAKVGAGHLIDVGAKVAAPALAALAEGGKGVDVGAALAAADDARGAKVHHGDAPLAQRPWALCYGVAGETQGQRRALEQPLIPGHCAKGKGHVPRQALLVCIQHGHGGGGSCHVGVGGTPQHGPRPHAHHGAP